MDPIFIDNEIDITLSVNKKVKQTAEDLYLYLNNYKDDIDGDPSVQLGKLRRIGTNSYVQSADMLIDYLKDIFDIREALTQAYLDAEDTAIQANQRMRDLEFNEYKFYYRSLDTNYYQICFCNNRHDDSVKYHNYRPSDFLEDIGNKSKNIIVFSNQGTYIRYGSMFRQAIFSISKRQIIAPFQKKQIYNKNKYDVAENVGFLQSQYFTTKTINGHYNFVIDNVRFPRTIAINIADHRKGLIDIKGTQTRQAGNITGNHLNEMLYQEYNNVRSLLRIQANTDNISPTYLHLKQILKQLQTYQGFSTKLFNFYLEKLYPQCNINLIPNYLSVFNQSGDRFLGYDFKIGSYAELEKKNELLKKTLKTLDQNSQQYKTDATQINDNISKKDLLVFQNMKSKCVIGYSEPHFQAKKITNNRVDVCFLNNSRFYDIDVKLKDCSGRSVIDKQKIFDDILTKLNEQIFPERIYDGVVKDICKFFDYTHDEAAEKAAIKTSQYISEFMADKYFKSVLIFELGFGNVIPATTNNLNNFMSNLASFKNTNRYVLLDFEPRHQQPPLIAEQMALDYDTRGNRSIPQSRNVLETNIKIPLEQFLTFTQQCLTPSLNIITYTYEIVSFMCRVERRQYLFETLRDAEYDTILLDNQRDPTYRPQIVRTNTTETYTKNYFLTKLNKCKIGVDPTGNDIYSYDFVVQVDGEDTNQQVTFLSDSQQTSLIDHCVNDRLQLVNNVEEHIYMYNNYWPYVENEAKPIPQPPGSTIIEYEYDTYLESDPLRAGLKNKSKSGRLDLLTYTSTNVGPQNRKLNTTVRNFSQYRDYPVYVTQSIRRAVYQRIS